MARRGVQDEAGVDLVGEDHRPVAGGQRRDGVELGRLEHPPHRVPRVAQDEQSGAVGHGRPDGLQVQGPAGAPVRPGGAQGRHLQALAPVQGGDGQERHVRRCGHDHGRAGPRVVGDDRVQGGQDVGQERDRLGVHVPAQPLAVVGGDGLAHPQGQVGGHVPQEAVVDGAVQRRADDGGRAQVHLGHPGGDDVAGVVVPLERAAPAHLLGGQGVPRGGERPGAVGGGVGGAGGIGGAGGSGARHGASVGAGRRPARPQVWSGEVPEDLPSSIFAGPGLTTAVSPRSWSSSVVE